MQQKWQPDHEFGSLYYAKKDRQLIISWHPIKENQMTSTRGGVGIFRYITYLACYMKNMHSTG